VDSYAIIVNPTSGRGRALERAEELEEALGESRAVEVLQTSHRGAAIDLAARCVGEVDRVIAVGGDGTLNEVLTGLMTTGRTQAQLPELGFLPAGTANVAVKALRVGSNPASVAEALATADSIPLDVGRVRYDGGERAFLLWFGAGWDAVLIHALNADRSGLMGVSGLLGHTPSVLRAFVGYDQPPITAHVDGSAFGVHSNVIVANVGEAGFGAVIAEGVDPCDALLNVVGVPHASLLRFVRLAFHLMTSNLARARGVSHKLGADITIQSEDRDVPFHVDGEPVGSLPATVSVLPGAVRFLRT